MNKPNRAILITGCSSGIGLAAARCLKEHHWNVLPTARKPSDVARLRNEGWNAEQLDLDDSASIRRGFEWALAQTQKSGSRLDALFNNAGWGMGGRLEDTGRDALRAIFESNVFGTQELTNLVVRHMRRHEIPGRILYNSSVLGYVTLKNRVSYCATKYALESFADGMRLELRDSSIRVILIEPGPITSDFRKNAYLAYKKWIKPAESLHEQEYLKEEAGYLRNKNKSAPFTLGPEAVNRAVLRALHSRNPKSRYRITFPSVLFWYLRRILPVRLLDNILNGIK